MVNDITNAVQTGEEIVSTVSSEVNTTAGVVVVAASASLAILNDCFGIDVVGELAK